jgi:RNA polymerase sigma factor (sigma-70 family)
MTTARAEPLGGCIRQIAAASLAVELSDHQLLERYAGRGDEAAFTALVRRHGPLVLGVCRRVLRDPHAAEDAFQATFLVLARRAGAVSRPEALGPWLHGVAARVALKARAREARRRAVEHRAAAQAPTTAGPGDPSWQDLRPLLDEAVRELPDKLRTPFVLHYLEGRTVSDVARRLGSPRGTVATHLARARQRLRRGLLRRGLALAAAGLDVALSQNLAAAAVAPALLKTAAGFAARHAAGSVPAGIASLAHGGLQAMSLSKHITVAVLFVLTVGAAGGMVLLAQGTAAKEPAGAAAAPAAEETDLALFRAGGRRFRAEEYPAAERCFRRLVEAFPDSPLAPHAEQLADIAGDMSAMEVEASVPLARAVMARKIIDAVLAGARAAEARQDHPGPRKQPVRGAARDERKANELLRQFSNLYKEGKYQEAESCAAKALELEPENPVAAAAWEIARRHCRLEKFQRVKDGKAGQTGWPISMAELQRLGTKAAAKTAQEAKEKEIDKRLQRPVNLNFKGVPLSQVLADIRLSHGLNFMTDHRALERDGISPDGPVNVHLEGVSLKSALKLLLGGLELTYVVRDGAIVVTTPTAARGKLIRRIYQVEKLLGGDATGGSLIPLIMNNVEPETWQPRGGPGSIDFFPHTRCLIILQSPDVHEEVDFFLNELVTLVQAKDSR